jgi:hypothetical protein
MEKKQIPPFEYLSGAEFTDNLKTLTGSKTFNQLSHLLNVSKATFSTWNTHDRTSHELMVRLHLALGIPIEQLALKPKDRRLNDSCQNSDVISSCKVSPQQDADKSPQHHTVIMKSFCLSGGKLIDTGEIPYPVRRINSLVDSF